MAIKSASEIICFQEVPDEVSLSFAISNCPFNCEGCHSPWLQYDCGQELENIILPLLDKYNGLISCVLFMGGDDSKQINELKYWLQVCKSRNLKTALYSGFNDLTHLYDILPLLDYIKIGSYMKQYGGLKSPTTNQVMYKNENGELKEITYKFWTSEIKQ